MMTTTQMMRGAGLAAAVAGALAVTGCVTTVQRTDPTQEKLLTTQFSADDLQQTVDKMVDSMLEFPPLKEITSQRRPVLVVDKIKNDTSQYLNLEALTNSIRTKLIRSGKYRFQDRTNDATLANEIAYQQQSGLVNPATQAQFRQQSAPEYMLYGSIVEMTQQSGRTTDVFYKVTLNLRNIRTGELDWTDEQMSRKVQTAPVFGR